MPPITIKQLSVYPVKSTRGFNLDRMQLDHLGPMNDRRWMLVDSENRFLTQRQHPEMCLIGTLLENQTLILTAPGKNSCRIEMAAGQEQEVKIWSDLVIATDCGSKAAQWLSDYLKKDCRLVYMPDQTRRLVDQNHAQPHQTVGFADGFPLLLISQASLEDFNSKLDEPIGMDRFRPNIVIDGCEAYAEDNWKELKVGDISLSLVKPCSRCVIPSIDPSTGTKQAKIIDSLNTFRRRDNAIYFGQNTVHDKPGEIAVGDTVTLIE